MKIAGDRGAVGHQPALLVLALPDRRIHQRRPDPVLLDPDPAPPLDPRDPLVTAKTRGSTRSRQQDRVRVRRRKLHAGGRTTYWACGSWHIRHPRLPDPRTRGLPLLAREARDHSLVPVAGRRGVPLPYLAALAGWVLTEVGRQPWIVWGLLKTADANSPSVSTATIASASVSSASSTRADRPRLRPPAPLRARRPTRGGRRR